MFQNPYDESGEIYEDVFLYDGQSPTAAKLLKEHDLKCEDCYMTDDGDIHFVVNTDDEQRVKAFVSALVKSWEYGDYKVESSGNTVYFVLWQNVAYRRYMSSDEAREQLESDCEDCGEEEED